MLKRSLFLFALLCDTCLLMAQDTGFIRLRNEALPKQLSHFHITGVRDDRADTGSMGTLKTGLLGKKKMQVAFRQGASGALQEFVAVNFRQQAATTPVELHIAELSVTEQPGGLRTRIETVLKLAFWVNGARVSDYRGAGEVKTMGDVLKHVEDLFREHLQNCLEEFDGWWAKNRLLYEQNAPVSIAVEFVHTAKDSSQIAYAPRRPLTFNDFMAEPDELSRAAAQTATAMTLKYATSADNGQINLKVLVSAYFEKQRSWFGKKHQGNAKILLHEQKHFDITALKACELADTLRQQKLTRENYQEVLEQVHAQKQRELEALQRLYDTETKHGTIVAIQEKWNRWITDRLAEKTCYKGDIE